MGNVQGWTEPATLSAVFLMLSPACSVADFWLSGFRAEVALSVVDWRLRRKFVSHIVQEVGLC